MLSVRSGWTQVQPASFICVAAIALDLFSRPAVSAEPQELTWDIGNEPSFSGPINPGSYRIKLRGRLSNANYQIRVTLETLSVEALPKTNGIPDPFKVESKAVAPDIEPECKPPTADLDSKLKIVRTTFEPHDLSETNAEKSFAAARSNFDNALRATPEKCLASEQAVQLISEYRAIVAASEHELSIYSIRKGQVLHVNLTRSNPDVEYSYELSTGKRGVWQASWGLGILPDNNQHFFAKEAGAEQFSITRKRDNGGLNPTAAIFYSWLPSARELSDWNAGVAVGIGVDRNSLALFLGPHVTFNQNVGLVAGASLHEETRLRGEFEPDQTVASALTSDALEEKINKVTWFVVLTLRFNDK